MEIVLYLFRGQIGRDSVSCINVPLASWEKGFKSFWLM